MKTCISLFENFTHHIFNIYIVKTPRHAVELLVLVEWLLLFLLLKEL